MKEQKTSLDKKWSDMRRCINGWLVEFEYTVNSQPFEQSHWTLIADNPIGERVAVSLIKGKPDLLVIEGRLTITDEQQAQLSRLSSRDRRSLLWSLRFNLLSTGVDFSPIQEPLTSIGLSVRLFYNGLTKQTLFDKVMLIERAKLAANWVLRETLERPVEADSSAASPGTTQ